MKIQNIETINYQNKNYKQQNFKGYDARPLDKIVIRNPKYFPFLHSITRELVEISKKYSFKVLSEGNKIFEGITDIITFGDNTRLFSPWIQDMVSINKGKLLYKRSDYYEGELSDYLGIKSKQINPKRYISGGNMFLLEDGTMLLGEAERTRNAGRLYKPKRIIKIPQADFHLDLFMRPLKNNVILVADDNMTIEILERMKSVLSKDPHSKEKMLKIDHCIYKMKYALKSCRYSSTEDVIKVLEENGFEVVRVPGRIVESNKNDVSEIINIMNFMNAIAHEEPNGDLVYITNKSSIMHRFGISNKQSKYMKSNFEEIFVNLVKKYIKSQNIHFINGRSSYFGESQDKQTFQNMNSIQHILETLGGGIHCLTLEVPKSEISK